MSDRIILPSNPQDRKKIEDAISEIAHALQEVEDKRSFMNDIVTDLKEQFELNPKLTRKLAKAKHEHNFPDVQAEHETFEYLFEALFEGRNDE